MSSSFIAPALWIDEFYAWMRDRQLVVERK